MGAELAAEFPEGECEGEEGDENAETSEEGLEGGEGERRVRGWASRWGVVGRDRHSWAVLRGIWVLERGWE